MKCPKVSIITPSYNKGQFIERTILSVLNQDYPNIEYIVIDGGSTDNTLEILRKYEHKLIGRSEPDRGQSEAINKGFKLASGDILAELDADDVYRPRAISKVVNFFEKNPDVGMVYGDCDIIDENDRHIRFYDTEPFDYQRYLNEKDIIPQPSAFFRKEVIENVGFLDENLNYAMDLEFFLRIGRQYKIQYIKEHLASFRVYGHQKTHNMSLRQYWASCKEQNKVREKYGANLLIKRRIDQYYVLLRKFLLNLVY